MAHPFQNDEQLTDFPPLFDDFLPTQPVALEKPVVAPMTKEQALEVISAAHPRIFNSVSLLWGRKECDSFLNNLIMQGGDGVSRVRQGFAPEVLTACMRLLVLNEEDMKHVKSSKQGLAKLVEEHTPRNSVWAGLDTR